MKRRFSPNALTAAIAGGALLLAVLGYLALIGPQRSTSAELQREIEATEQSLATNRLLSRTSREPEQVRAADLALLSRALPDRTDMAGVILQLSRIARDTNITFASISPKEPLPLGAYAGVPIELGFEGNFYELSDFLFRLRSLVAVRDGRLDATGRLFAVQSLDFNESPGGFPEIQAKLNVVAFVYGAPAAPAAGSPLPAAPAETAPAPGETTPTVPDPPTSATAAGATP